MNVQRNRKVSFLVAVVVCCAMLAGCHHAPEAKVNKTAGTAAAQIASNGFIAQSEFCRARTVHVGARLNVLEALQGTCYVEEAALPSGVGAIFKRTLKLNNLKITQDPQNADYLLTCNFDNRFSRGRTHTTINVTFAKNKGSKAVVWVGAATVSARGTQAADLYAASLAGAVMYVFRQSASCNVGLRHLRDFYLSLNSVGE